MHELFINKSSSELSIIDPLIEKFILDSQLIQNSLKPLFYFGIRYKLLLSGGAIRDLLLGQPIKDLDFVISLKIPSNSAKRQSLNKKIAPLIFSKKLLQKYPIDSFFDFDTTDIDPTKQNSFQHHLLNLCVAKNGLYLNSFFSNHHDKVEEFIDSTYNIRQNILNHDRLAGVIKLQSKSLNFPSDLLISNFFEHQFIESFDFDICKTYIELFNNFMQFKYLQDFPTNLKNLPKNLPTSAQEFKERIVLTSNFLHDVNNQIISYNLDGRSKEEILRSAEKHLPRLIQKYPHYSIRTYSNALQENHAFKDLAHSAFLKAKLNIDLPCIPVKKKSKI